ncbi:IS3 family transposase [Salinispora arenicola]|uniref:IS3 family transposase n=1 Tax=Salinispora arenicola TaxID=168697 RepID=UPI0035584E1E
MCERTQRVFDDNYRVDGARKVRRALLRQDVPVARFTVRRLMRRACRAPAAGGQAQDVSDPAQPKSGPTCCGGTSLRS